MLARFSQELDTVLSKTPLSEKDRSLIQHLKSIFDIATKETGDLILIDEKDRKSKIHIYNQVHKALELTAFMLESLPLKGALSSLKEIVLGASKYLSEHQIRLRDYLDLENQMQEDSMISILFADVYQPKLKMFSGSATLVSIEEYESLLKKVKMMFEEILAIRQIKHVANDSVRVFDDYEGGSKENEKELEPGSEKKQPEKQVPHIAKDSVRFIDNYDADSKLGSVTTPEKENEKELEPGSEKKQPEKQARAPFLMFEDYAGLLVKQAEPKPDVSEGFELVDDDDDEDIVVIVGSKNRKNK